MRGCSSCKGKAHRFGFGKRRWSSLFHGSSQAGQASHAHSDRATEAKSLGTPAVARGKLAENWVSSQTPNKAGEAPQPAGPRGGRTERRLERSCAVTAIQLVAAFGRTRLTDAILAVQNQPRSHERSHESGGNARSQAVVRAASMSSQNFGFSARAASSPKGRLERKRKSLSEFRFRMRCTTTPRSCRSK